MRQCRQFRRPWLEWSAVCGVSSVTSSALWSRGVWSHDVISMSQTRPGVRGKTTVNTSHSLIQGGQILHSNWIRLAPNGTNLGICKISFSTFWLGCQIWHPNWVSLAPNWTNLGLFQICFGTFWLTHLGSI